MKFWKDYGATIVGVAVAILGGVVAYLVIIEQDDREKLQGVTVVGPCRASYSSAKQRGASDREATGAATRNKECQLQSMLLFETCVRRELHPACKLAGDALKDFKAQRPLKQDDSPVAPTGGGSSSAAPPSSQPSPPPPSGGPPPSTNPPGNPNPPANPPGNPPQGPVGDLLDDVCTITSPLGICLN